MRGRPRDFGIETGGASSGRGPSERTAHAGPQKVSPRALLLGDPAEHNTEERVAPSRLRERARIGEQPRDAGFAACRVITIDEVAERIEHDVLGDRHADGELPGVGRQDAPHLVKSEPEQRTVEGVDRESGGSPTSAAARHCFAKERDIGIVAAQKLLVEWLQQRPHDRSRSPGRTRSQTHDHLLLVESGAPLPGFQNA
jgi:hypothetical protein